MPEDVEYVKAIVSGVLVAHALQKANADENAAWTLEMYAARVRTCMDVPCRMKTIWWQRGDERCSISQP